MNKADFQLLVDVRVTDAEALLTTTRWAAAYYLLGYAVECALKVCIARQFRQDEVPEKATVNRFYTHDLEQLLNLSGLKVALESKCNAELAFQVNWTTVLGWNEDARYDHSIPEVKARDLHIAVTDSNSGVLTWLKTQW
ncbi:MAG: DNA-binding protein [Planctomycetia bacterium]|nr:DNA-binding protein [Planctomycetia bacterium]